jgi:hypothetical protein
MFKDIPEGDFESFTGGLSILVVDITELEPQQVN